MCVEKRTLAGDEGFGHIGECDCGTIHLTVGALSVALSVVAFRRLEALLAGAVRRLSSPSEEGSSSQPTN